MMKITDARIGYVPHSPTLASPADRRRFCYYASARHLLVDVLDHHPAHRDLVVLTSTADITRWAHADSAITIVYDLIDSYLALPRTAIRSVGRGVAKRLSGETSRLVWSYRKAIEAMCSRADAVVCSTLEQRESILPYCSNVHVILDHHGPEVAQRKVSFEAGSPFRVVWEGLPYTLPAFREISRSLERVRNRHAIELHLVTDLELYRAVRRFGRLRTEDFAARYVANYRLHEWRPDTLADIVTTSDLAVIPARLDDPMSCGKPENKLLLFWRMAMPTLTSATPAYRRAMDAAGLDMTCTSPSDWETQLEQHILDGEARRTAGELGYRFCRESHSEQRLLSQWDGLVASLGFDAGHATASTR
jgi:adenylate kinase family enzyme